MLLRARHYATEHLIDIDIDGPRINEITQADHKRSADLVADVVAPAWFDLQINGGYEANFTSERLTQEAIETVVEVCAANGVAAFCPTVITAASTTIALSLKILRNACENNTALNEAMPCFHLEGPFISPEDGPRGAHPREHVQVADYQAFQRWQEAAGGRIRLVTLAPEVPGALKLIEQLVKDGVVVALGHSAGPPAAIRDGIRAGAKLSTHLGNGCARMVPRHDNVLWEQLASDELMASVITDGHHLPWNVLQCIVRCKSLDRLIVTCDASPLAGLQAGRYDSWGQSVEITSDGKIVLAEQGVLAGSWDFTSACLEKLMAHLSLSYAQVHPLASDHPRNLLGLPVRCMEQGEPADLVLLQRQSDGALKHTRSFIRGRVIERPATALLPVAAGR